MINNSKACQPEAATCIQKWRGSKNYQADKGLRPNRYRR